MRIPTLVRQPNSGRRMEAETIAPQRPATAEALSTTWPPRGWIAPPPSFSHLHPSVSPAPWLAPATQPNTLQEGTQEYLRQHPWRSSADLAAPTPAVMPRRFRRSGPLAGPHHPERCSRSATTVWRPGGCRNCGMVPACSTSAAAAAATSTCSPQLVGTTGSVLGIDMPPASWRWPRGHSRRFPRRSAFGYANVSFLEETCETWAKLPLGGSGQLSNLVVSNCWAEPSAPTSWPCSAGVRRLHQARWRVLFRDDLTPIARYPKRLLRLTRCSYGECLQRAPSTGGLQQLARRAGFPDFRAW